MADSVGGGWFFRRRGVPRKLDLFLATRILREMGVRMLQGWGDVLLAWQAWRTLSARRISPLLSRTRLMVASSWILMFSFSMTWSTRDRISGSFKGLNRNLVHLESRAGESLWV